MKRSTIHLATIASFAGIAAAETAHAQSSVTLYGIVDAGVEYVNHASPDGGAARLVSGGKNTSRFGMRGAEDLGGGLIAVFQLESGINIANGQLDDGPNALFDRRATVGLKHKTYGQVILGRTFTTTYDFMLPFDPMAYAPNYSWATSSTATGGRKDGLFSRSANAVRYDGEFSGFKVGAMYGFGNVPGSMKTSSKYDFGLGYERGAFAVVATFDRQNGASDSVTPADTTNYIQGFHAGASYDFGAAKVMAGYRNMYWFGGSYDFAPDFTVYAAVYHQDIKGATDGDPTLLSVRANYSLSKRTTLYLSGGYAFAKNDQNVSLSRDLVGAADTQAGVTAGIQHRF
jgi:predicted porin